MPINFPSSASLNNTYTYEDKTWKYNAQGAWEISSSTETGNEQGNTGELAYYTGNNSIIQGATAFFYDDTNLRVGVGTIIPDHTLDVTGPFGTLNVKGGATVGGDLTVGGDIIMTDAETIKIGGDTEHIAFNGAGAEINVRANELSIDHYLQHFGDSNTHLEFQTDNITLAAGGVDAIDIVPSHINLGVGISTSNGATFGNNVIIQNAGDVALTVKGDTDNSGENDNPLVRLEQDGGAVSTNIGINGESNNQFTGAQPNAFYIESVSDSTDNQVIQFATNNNDRMTILGDGNVGINNNNPKHLLHLEGGGISADGATFDQLSVSGGGITADGGIYVAGGVTFANLSVNDNYNFPTSAPSEGNMLLVGSDGDLKFEPHTDSTSFVVDSDIPLATGIRYKAIYKVPYSNMVVTRLDLRSDDVSPSGSGDSLQVALKGIQRASTLEAAPTIQATIETVAIPLGGQYHHGTSSITNANIGEDNSVTYLVVDVTGNAGSHSNFCLMVWLGVRS